MVASIDSNQHIQHCLFSLYYRYLSIACTHPVVCFQLWSPAKVADTVFSSNFSITRQLFEQKKPQVLNFFVIEEKKVLNRFWMKSDDRRDGQKSCSTKNWDQKSLNNCFTVNFRAVKNSEILALALTLKNPP